MEDGVDGAQPAKTAVLFVCLGNICRSTMAEGVFRSMVAKGPYKDVIGEVDSCGTGAYHIDAPPDERTLWTLNDHGIDDYVHYGRQVRGSDFDAFDYIFAMDRNNLRDLERRRASRRGGEARRGKAKVMLWGAFAGEGLKEEVVEDPYYGGQNGFDKAYKQCTRFTTNFLRATFPDVEAEAEE